MAGTRHLTVASLRIEGGLISPGLVDRLLSARGTVAGSRPEDYHLETSIGEAATRSWNRLLSSWDRFDEARQVRPDRGPGAGETRDRILLPFFEELNFGRLPFVGGIDLNGKRVPISHLWGTVPVHLVGADTDLDKRTSGVAGAARMSPHSLVQDFLNRSDHHLWGIVTNGLRLRILRDNRSIARLPYIEFDLESIFEGSRYSDFLALWMVAHQSRFEGEHPEQCWLERWVEAGTEEGTRALETLRGGVEQAIELLGAGFLSAPENAKLRKGLADGTLSGEEFYRQILRLVYRLIFLMVAEDRGVLLSPSAPEAARDRYLNYFSMSRLRELAESIRGGEKGDLYSSLVFVMEQLFAEGREELGLPALGSSLWDPDSIRSVGNCALSNHAVLEALRKLAFTEISGALWRTDFRNLGSEELGSVYESLLELHPRIDAPAGRFRLGSEAGNERKVTGSYYTPSELVEQLLETALEPVIDQAVAGKGREDAQKAILDLKVCDPATGSGHFLVAAAARMGKRLAAVRTGEPEPAPEPVRDAVREVIARCIYGVDINPMAVELCKVSLWMEALEPGKPLSFLDHHIKVGNSLFGATPDLIARGIPDDAFSVLTLDEKEATSALKKRNREEREGALSLFAGAESRGNAALLAEAARLSHLDEATLAGVRELERQYRQMIKSDQYRRSRLAADAWCAAFVWLKQRNGIPAVTQEVIGRIEQEPGDVPIEQIREIDRHAKDYRFFHWHLEFPEVFDGSEGEAGFDVVVGNPPWEKLTVNEREFFAGIPGIGDEPRSHRRKKAIEQLSRTDEVKFSAWTEAKQSYEAQAHFIRASGRYRLTARGELNLYPLFAELSLLISKRNSRSGQVVKSTLLTAPTWAEFTRHLLVNELLVSALDFRNWRLWFPSVGFHERFTLLVMGTNRGRTATVGFMMDSPTESEKIMEVEPSILMALNPITGTLPSPADSRGFRLLVDATNRLPTLGGGSSGWEFRYSTGIHTGLRSEHLVVFEDLCETEGFVSAGLNSLSHVPVMEGKLLHGYNERFASFEGVASQSRFGKKPATHSPTDDQLRDPSYDILPRYWVSASTAAEVLKSQGQRDSWMIAFRDTTNVISNQRTMVAALVFGWVCGHKAPNIIVEQHLESDRAMHAAALIGMLNSFPFDFFLRQKFFGTNMLKSILHQSLVVPYKKMTPKLEWYTKRVAELSCTSNHSRGFAVAVGVGPSVFKWNPDRRFLLKCELDAAFFHLYGIAREDIDYIMDSFPIVRRHDEKQAGDYRTKRVILQMYDAMAEAIRADTPYQTSIAPPPGEGEKVLDLNEDGR